MSAIPMLLWCPECGERHIDEGEFETKEHHTHACQHCGHCWRPAIVPTTGVRFLPGFKDKEINQEAPTQEEHEGIIAWYSGECPIPHAKAGEFSIYLRGLPHKACIGRIDAIKYPWIPTGGPEDIIGYYLHKEKLTIDKAAGNDDGVSRD